LLTTFLSVDRDIYFVLSPAQGASVVVQGDYLVEIGPGVYQAGITIPQIAAGDWGVSFVFNNAPAEGRYLIAVGN
jgi:hypothetical protein